MKEKTSLTLFSPLLFSLLSLFFLSLLAGCAETNKPAPSDRLALSPVSFSDLPGWNDDHISEAIPALARSCAVILKKGPNGPVGTNPAGAGGLARDWQPACTALARSTPSDDASARAFLQQYFRPYAAEGAGLFTGYYEAELRGSTSQNGIYQTPLYAQPDDLIHADLGDFKPELHGQHIVGKVVGKNMKPYDARAEIAQGSLVGRAHVLIWVDDPVDAFFLEVQGSGRIRLTDGSVTRVGYDGANGRAYVAIGRALSDKGLIEKPVTMQKIKAWLAAHPDRMQEILDLNPSYVFFKTQDNLAESSGPIGAEGLALTPRRSMAVDPAFVPLGAPVWLDTTDGHGNPFRHLMVAQDTGGAIKGPVRGDIFWGAGSEAEAEAGMTQGQGRIYLLLPQTTNVGK
jgi:membrane-bound lytic murein transglycosylase A